MFWGNCLGIKPNTRHIWQTVYFLCFIFSTKHGAWTILSPNWCIPQPGLWYKCELCGTASRSHCQIPHSHSLLQHVCMFDVPGLALITHHTQKRLLLENKQPVFHRWILDKWIPTRPHCFYLACLTFHLSFTITNVLLTAFLFSSNVTKKWLVVWGAKWFQLWLMNCPSILSSVLPLWLKWV